MKDNILATLAVVGIVALIFGIITWGCWMDSNGVHVYTDEPRAREIKETGQSYNIPIKVRGYIKYHDDRIVTRETIVEFCDVKESKKQMKQEMKVIWKEMRRECK